MALVNCPECNHSVSTEAQVCPHCGFPLRENIAEETKTPTVLEVETKTRTRSYIETFTFENSTSGQRRKNETLSYLRNNGCKVISETITSDRFRSNDACALSVCGAAACGPCGLPLGLAAGSSPGTINVTVESGVPFEQLRISGAKRTHQSIDQIAEARKEGDYVTDPGDILLSIRITAGIVFVIFLAMFYYLGTGQPW